MGFLDAFRNFLGLNRHNEPGTSGFDDNDPYKESFRNPIWQIDEDDDDIDDFRFSMSDIGIHFRIFNNPLEITRYFESQMDNMLKDFGFGFNNFFGDRSIETVPFYGPENKDNLRDRMLKPNPDAFAITQPEQKVDTNLDGKINRDEFLKMWNKEEVETAKPFSSYNFSKRCVTKQITRRPDGTIEQKQIFRDGEGNQQIVISKEIGDKKYVVTTRKDKNGIETKSEDLFNMDESELKDFTQKWASRDNANAYEGNLKYFPWEKFFSSVPKL